VHELSVAVELHRAARAELERRGGTALRSLCVEAGELSGVEPQLLEHAWEAVVAGGPDEGCTLTVVRVAARQVCAACGEIEERQPGSWLRLCPLCGSALRVEGGRELDLVELVVRTPARTGPVGMVT
jgi:hydrogenase nickel incorporation protein HypA/HybF